MYSVIEPTIGFYPRDIGLRLRVWAGIVCICVNESNMGIRMRIRGVNMDEANLSAHCELEEDRALLAMMAKTEPISRRKFLAGCAVVTLAAVPLPGCSAKAGAAWTWRQDDDLPVLATEVAGGAQVAMPGDGWKSQGDWIQLQLAGGSIPGRKIAKVEQSGDALMVTLEENGSGIETMDMLLTEYRLEGGDARSVRSVTVKQGTETWKAQEAI